jgi:transcription elongation factor Elf1
MKPNDDEPGRVPVKRRNINFRCARCEATTTANLVWKDRETPVVVRCSSCGHRYSFHPSRPRHRNDEAYYLYVKKYAEKKRLDLATAYSVAEGIMTEDRALLFRGRPTRKAARKSRSRFRLPFIGMLAAVGLGTAFQSWSTWSHGNAPGPTTASLAGTPAATAGATPPPPALPLRRVALPATPGAPLRFARAATDADGWLTRVTAPDPRSVLAAWCAHGEEARLREPLGLAPAAPPSSEMVLGVYSDTNDLSTRFTIRIYRDPREGRWVAGNGRTRLVGADAGLLPYGTEVVPVAAAPADESPTPVVIAGSP